MSTTINTQTAVEKDVFQILLARQTAAIVMHGPDDDEDINPFEDDDDDFAEEDDCLLYTSPSPRDRQKSRMPSSA